MASSEIEGISEAQWAEIAAAAGRPAEELKAVVESARASSESSEPMTATLAHGENNYEIPIIPGVLAFKVSADVTPGDDWTADTTLTILLFDEEVDSQKHAFSPQERTVHITPSNPLYQVDMEFGFYGADCCFGMHGQAKVIGIGKKEINYDDIFCIF
ncbi:hypothetical protein ACIBG4_42135 [Nonomuraea sp. NPDC050383]|uniref:hypothetical protein n=1 Tax=Nonomuraea sp. NPDC050383 TaxID=3364362 RepID=UPI0037A802FD